MWDVVWRGLMDWEEVEGANGGTWRFDWAWESIEGSWLG
jgi:hypothetical protein